MKKALFLFVCASLHVQAQYFEWVFAEPNPPAPRGFAADVNATADGDCYVIANTFDRTTSAYGSITSNCPSTGNLLIAKHSNAGDPIWVRTGFGDIHAVSTDAEGNAYVTGFGGTLCGSNNSLSTDTSGCMVGKYAPNGELLWLKTEVYKHSITLGYDIATDPRGFSYVAIKGGTAGSYLVKFDGAGNRIWATPFQDRTTIFSVAIDSSGNVYITGIFNTTISFGNKTLTASGTPYYTFFIAKLSAAGQCVWAKADGGECYPKSISVEGTNVYVCGDSNGSNFSNTVLNSGDFLVRYDTSGKFVWARNMGAPGLFGVSATSNGGFVTGVMTKTLNIPAPTQMPTVMGAKSYRDFFVAYFDSTGEVKWGVAPGGTPSGETYPYNIASRNGDAWVCGRYAIGAQFDSKLVSAPSLNTNAYFLFVSKISDKESDATSLISEQSKNNIIIYPNPANTIVNISAGSSTIAANLIEIFSVQGALMKSISLGGSKQIREQSVDVAGLSRGVYLFKISYPNERSTTHKIILQ